MAAVRRTLRLPRQFFSLSLTHGKLAHVSVLENCVIVSHFTDKGNGQVDDFAAQIEASLEWDMDLN